MRDHAVDIRALREQSNQAIAARDAALVVSFFASDATVRVAGGPVLRGQDASQRAFAEQFADRAFRGYVRAPSQVTVHDTASAGLLTATERGEWVGRWQRMAGIHEQRGSYTAEWEHTAMGWRIVAETYVSR